MEPPTDKQITVRKIPVALIRPNPANRLVTQDMIDDLAESLKAVGLRNPVKLRPLADGTHQLYSGHVRLAGAIKLGWETIAAFVTDITPQEAAIEGIWDNRNQPQNWLDDYRDIEVLLGVNPAYTVLELTKPLGMSERSIQRGKRLLRCLNQASRDLIRQSLAKSRAEGVQSLHPTGAQGDQNSANPAKIWELAENPVFRLTALEDPEKVFKALQVLIDRQMTEPQAKGLVEWVQGGNQPESYNPQMTPKVKKALAATPQNRTNPNPGPGEKALSGIAVATLSAPPAQVPQKGPTGSAPRDGGNKIEGIKEKLKAGKKLGGRDNLRLVAHYAGKALGWLGKHVLRLAKEGFHLLWRLIRDSLKGLAKILGPRVYRLTTGVLAIVFLALLVWFVWVAWSHRGFHPMRPIREAFSYLKGKVEPPSAPNSPVANPPVKPPMAEKPISVTRSQVPAKRPPTQSESAKASEKAPRPAPLKPENFSSHPWKAEDESQDNLEAEIAAVPLPAWIKAFPLQPDSMGGDMATRRLGDLMDPDKYTLIVGHDRRKVTSVSPAMTGLTLEYTDPSGIGGLLGGPSKMEFYWEDVRAIHCDELDSGGRAFYQLGLVADGTKRPLTVRCATAGDLRHLVSALEFWIGAAAKGRQAPLSGMPYPSRGLRMDGEGKVVALWAGNGMERTGVELGDRIWSLDVDARQPQGGPYLEAALRTLPPGKHGLYTVASADWGNGPPGRTNRFARPFNPKRRKVELVVP